MTIENQKKMAKRESKLISDRRSKLRHIRKECRSGGYPNDFVRDNLAGDLQVKFRRKTKEELEELDLLVAIAGRIVAKRGPFFVIQEASGRIQTYATKGAQRELKSKYQGLDIGDIIGVKGTLSKSLAGDLYVNMESCHMLTKALRPLPDKFHGLADQEACYRQRYVDLIVNEDSRGTFIIRSKLIGAIRRFMVERKYLEVETPMMHTVPGGATARPFITRYNALDTDMYLRIAPELYLKRLVVGGFDRVFEINKSFRNENLSVRHSPEFTMMEFYQAYSSFEDLMDLTEDLLSSVTESILGSTSIPYGGSVIKLGGKYARMSMLEAVKHYNQGNEGIQGLDYDRLRDCDHMINIAKSLRVEVESPCICGQILEAIFSKTVEHQLIQPTFVTGYPIDISPLARCNDKNTFIADRFELFIGGREIANGFSELNDAEEQSSRFKAQAENRKVGDKGTASYDTDYIVALEYGLPPTAGQGIGIDRLVMLLTNSHAIRDVILFPSMRPKVD